MSNWARYSKHSKSILDCIGNTPLVRLTRVTKDVQPEILVKLEYFSPSGSLKDRIYLNMIERAEKRGDLKPGMTILECSTGNAGIACSFVAAVKGYPCIIVMPEGMSEERKKMDVAYGTQMIYTPGGESDVDLALQQLERIRQQDPEKYWVPSQFDNPDNIKAHYKTTGPEIWEQTEGRIDVFVAGMGTGGTLMGTGRRLREELTDFLSEDFAPLAEFLATIFAYPLVLAVWELARRKTKSLALRLKEIVLQLVPYAVVAAGYLALRFSVLGLISWKHPFMAQVPDSAIWMTVWAVAPARSVTVRSGTE